MQIDLMTGASSWQDAADLARKLEGAGFSGMLYTETAQVPWMQIAAASIAAASLFFTTGIAVAFPRSPMLSAAMAYEITANTGGRFRLGLGSQVKAHVERRYSADFDRPAARMRDYVEAVKAAWRAFKREERLDHHREFYEMTLLPPDWAPRRHDFEMKVDISAVGPMMTKVAAQVADGVHVHPLHSMAYLENRLLPDLAAGAGEVRRDPNEVDLIVPVFACPGDTPEERAADVATARRQIAFYGSTPNYAIQFDDLGFDGTTGHIRTKFKSGELDAIGDVITDEMLDHFAVVAPWDQLADALISQYAGRAARVVMYLGEHRMRTDPQHLARWGEVARAVQEAR